MVGTLLLAWVMALVACGTTAGVGTSSPPTDGQNTDAGTEDAPVGRSDGGPVAAPQQGGPLTDPPGPYIDVASGGSHFCAVAQKGTVECSGTNYHGQTHKGQTGKNTPYDRVESGYIGDAIAVSAGWQHTCALSKGGEITCWGAHHGGADPPPGGGFAHLSCGTNHSCAAHGGGEVVCWGENTYGQLGAAPGEGKAASSQSTPVTVGGITDATAVSAGFAHTCALHASGKVSCWGRNDAGELGDGRAIPRPGPSGNIPGKQTVKVMQIWNGPCAKSGLDCVDERLVAVPIRSEPGRVVKLSDAKAIAVGHRHACALRENGRVLCWGANMDGVLGRAKAGATSTPWAIKGLSDAVALSAGTAHNCVVVGGGEVLCWGKNRFGAIGDGTTDGRIEPTKAALAERARRVSAGDSHSCVLTPPGQVWCWGRVAGLSKTVLEPFVFGR